MSKKERNKPKEERNKPKEERNKHPKLLKLKPKSNKKKNNPLNNKPTVPQLNKPPNPQKMMNKLNKPPNPQKMMNKLPKSKMNKTLKRDCLENWSKWTLNGGTSFFINYISYNGEGLPRTNKNYTDAKEKEKVNFVLYMKEDIKPALPWGLNVIYRYIWNRRIYSWNLYT